LIHFYKRISSKNKIEEGEWEKKANTKNGQKFFSCD